MSDHVLLIDDQGSPSGSLARPSADLLPTHENLDWAFREWLPARVEPGDVVVVYFAGQARGGSSPVDAPASRAESASSCRSTPARATSTTAGWRLDEAIDDLAAKGTNPIVCWLDTSLDGRGRPVAGRLGRRAVGHVVAPPTRPLAGRDRLARRRRPAGREAARAGRAGPFAAALLAGLGTRERPKNLYAACLHDLGHDPALARQGFRSLGGVDPDLDLWAGSIRQAAPIAAARCSSSAGTPAAVSALAFTADGARLVTGAQDSTIKVWDAADRRLLRAAELSPRRSDRASRSSPDGRLLASGDGAGRLRVWDLAADRLLPDLPPHERGVDSLGFLPDGRHLASLDMDGKAWLWDLSEPGTPPRLLDGESTAIACAPARGPVGLIVAGRDGRLRLFGADGVPLEPADGPGGLVAGRALATDGHIVVAGGDGGALLIWDAEARAARLRRSFGARVDAVALSAAGDLAVASGNSLHWPTSDRPAPLALDDPASEVAFSLDGRWLACATATGANPRLATRCDGGPRPARTGRRRDDGPDLRARRLVARLGRSRRRHSRLAARRRDPPARHHGPARAGGRPLGLSRRAAPAASHPRRPGAGWDLQEGRALTILEGSWSAGVLTPDGTVAVLADRATGEVVACDRANGRRRPTRFARPDAEASVRVGKLAALGRRPMVGGGRCRFGPRLALGGRDRPARQHDPRPRGADPAHGARLRGRPATASDGRRGRHGGRLGVGPVGTRYLGPPRPRVPPGRRAGRRPDPDHRRPAGADGRRRPRRRGGDRRPRRPLVRGREPGSAAR